MAVSTTVTEAPLPGAYRTRIGVELKEFFRQREGVTFTVLFPVVLLLGLGSVLDYDIGAGVDFSQYFMAGVIAAGIVGASLQNLGIYIASERADGTLKMLRGTPMPASAYFVGKVVQVLAVAAVTIVLLLVVGVLVYDIDLPSAADWVTFLWVALLGITACTLLGIAVSSLAPNRRSASALISPAALLLEFVSGVFMPFGNLPHWLQVVSSFFPVKWMAQGMRSVFLPDALQVDEPAGSWELDRVAIVLAVWCVLGLVLCVRTFRWQDRGDR
ncbi:ABC transporter permease [Modestobacter sp. NPDC049651]|uniref:ABC transporter permease n=1 Tax=Modestobacter sp. NPDC049651 TaxID=3155777 RepID=UPI0033CD7B03